MKGGSLRLAVAAGVIIVVLGWQTIEAVNRNSNLRQKIRALENDIVIQDEQRQRLHYEVMYYQTDAYRDRQAREKLGLQLPGEGVVILPNK